jgi:ketosteroid isomerase-like protein
VSEETVSVVRAFYERWDPWDLEPAFELLAPQIEWGTAPTSPSAGKTIYGKDALRRHWQELLSAESDTDKGSVTVERLVDLGDEVLGLEREVLIGRSSGARTEARTGGIYTVTDGLIVRVRGFMSHREALEAAGLSE